MKMNLKILFERISIATLLLIVLAFGYKATYMGGVNWAHDFHSYHLPLALHMYGLTTQPLSSANSYLYSFLPPLTEIIEGGMIYLSGKFVAACLMGVLGLSIFNITLRLYLNFKQILVLNLYLLATPIIVINLPTGLTDIWVNLFLSLAVIAMMKIMSDVWNDLEVDSLNLIVLIISITVAYYSKLQSWITIFFLFLSVVVALIVNTIRAKFVIGKLSSKFRRNNLNRLTMCALIILMLAFVWPLRNWISLGNPLAPFIWGPDQKDKFLHFAHLITDFNLIDAISYLKSSVAAFFKPLFTPSQLMGQSHSTLYFISYFELTRLFTDQPMVWSSSQWHGGAESLHQMMGGLNGLLSLSCLILLVIAMLTKQMGIFPFIYLFSLAVLLSMQQQSHEMRYWLVVPMVSFFLLVRYARDTWFRLVVAGVPVIFMGLLFYGSILGANSIFTLNESLFQMQPDIKIFWNTHNKNSSDDPYCIPYYKTKPWLTDPLSIYFSGPNFSEFYVKSCPEN